MAEISASVYQLIDRPISCHTWSKDGKRVAICPNNETVQIYTKTMTNTNEEWKLETTLASHDQLVTAMDWDNSNSKVVRLLTVSSDRNGYVWTGLSSGDKVEWQQSLVLLRLRRAATCVQWTRDGSKFAVGGSEGVVSIGYYEADNDWWVCKHLRNLDGSSILSIAWHPSGNVLAVGTLAGKCHLLTTSLKGSSNKLGKHPSWIEEDQLDSFDRVVRQIDANSWIHSLSFSPSGDLLALATHDGSVHMFDHTNKCHQVVISPSKLPLRHLNFVSESIIVVAGFGSLLFLIARTSSSEWKFESELKDFARLRTNDGSSSVKAFDGALAKFKSLDQRGIALNLDGAKTKGLSEFHQSSISDLRVRDEMISTTGYDGWSRKRINIVFARVGDLGMTIPVPVQDPNTQSISTECLAKILHNLEGKHPLAERFRALFTLRSLNTDETVEIIGATFSDPSALLKHELAYVLGQMRRPHAIPILIRVLEDKHQETIVRHEAAEALGAIGSANILPILEKYRTDDARTVRETCEIAIDLITKQERTIQTPTTSSAHGELVFGSVDPAPPLRGHYTVQELESRLLDPSLDLYTRYKAMFGLRNRGTEAAVRALCKGFDDSSALFRHEIAYVLGQLQHPASVPTLVTVLRNSDEIGMVRHECAEALGSIATPECLVVLKEFENDPEDVVRESCIIARDMYEYETSSDLHFYPSEEKRSL